MDDGRLGIFYRLPLEPAGILQGQGGGSYTANIAIIQFKHLVAVVAGNCIIAELTPCLPLFKLFLRKRLQKFLLKGRRHVNPLSILQILAKNPVLVPVVHTIDQITLPGDKLLQGLRGQQQSQSDLKSHRVGIILRKSQHSGYGPFQNHPMVFPHFCLPPTQGGIGQPILIFPIKIGGIPQPVLLPGVVLQLNFQHGAAVGRPKGQGMEPLV